MPDVTVWDVFEGARNTWGNSATLAGMVPKTRIYDFQASDATVLPYVVLELDDVSAYFGGTEYYSGGDYVKTNVITFAVYGVATGGFDWRTLSQTMGDVFGWSVAASAGSWEIPNAVKVLSAMPETDKPEITFERINGVDVLRYASQFSVKMQCNRG